MKKLAIGILTLTASLSVFAEYNKDCARRYIKASKELVRIANDYNNAEIRPVEYATQVAAVKAGINVHRVLCFNENRSAQECVRNTKPVYQKIKNKMYVTEVLKGNLNTVEVSELDLLALSKASIKGFFKKIFRGDEKNICRVNN